MLWAMELLFRCLSLINVVNSVGAVHRMWRWWLPSLGISSLLYLHVSMSSTMPFFLVQVASWGIPKVHSFLELLRQWVRSFPILEPLFTCLAWISLVFMSSLLGLNPRVRFELIHGWAFVHPRTGPMNFMLCSNPSLPQFIFRLKNWN